MKKRTSLIQLLGKEVVRIKPTACHECAIEKPDCVKLILAGNRLICLR